MNFTWVAPWFPLELVETSERNWRQREEEGRVGAEGKERNGKERKMKREE